MIAALAVTLIGLTLGGPADLPAVDVHRLPAPVAAQGVESDHVTAEQEAGEGHATEAGPGDQHAEPGEHAEEWNTETMVHHIVDSGSLDHGSISISLDPLKIPPYHVGGVEINLSPTKHVVFLWLASLLTILTVGLAARGARRMDVSRDAPRGILNFFETFYVYLRDDVALANIGHGGEKFVPFVVTLFFFILYANLMGLVPGGASATGNISVTAALAAISFIVIEVAGFMALGPKGYMGTIFFVPKGIPPFMQVVMLIIMTPVEIIGKLAKPFALAVRLFANMTAGHFVLLSLIGLVIVYGGISATGLVTVTGSMSLGLFVMFLEIFVAFLQAYIFTVLTAVFIGLIRHAH